ncbi:hypothetical protein ACFLZN_02115 [Nanoarchaeota archaeon]
MKVKDKLKRGATSKKFLLAACSRREKETARIKVELETEEIVARLEKVRELITESLQDIEFTEFSRLLVGESILWDTFEEKILKLKKDEKEHKQRFTEDWNNLHDLRELEKNKKLSEKQKERKKELEKRRDADDSGYFMGKIALKKTICKYSALIIKAIEKEKELIESLE